MDTLVVLTPETAVITTENNSTVVSDNNVVTTVVTGLMGPPGSTNLSDATDVDVSQLQTGSTLVYDDAINKWKATKLLDQQIVECGQF